MIPNSEILDAVPQAGAERAAAVFLMMKDQGSVMAAARAILAYEEWKVEQGAEMRFLIFEAIEKLVNKIRSAREQFRREAGK